MFIYIKIILQLNKSNFKMGNDMCFCHRRKNIDTHKNITPYQTGVNTQYILSNDLIKIIDTKNNIDLDKSYLNYNTKFMEHNSRNKHL